MQKSKILIFFLFALAFSCSAQNKTIAGQHPVTHVGLMEPILMTKDIAPPPLTIEAALIALDKLGEQLLKFSKPATNEKK